MALVTLHLRDMKTGQRMSAEFETLDSCVEWLEHRPQFIDVLGPADESLTAEGERTLRKALRPFDAEENDLILAARQKREAEMERAHAAERVEREKQRAERDAAVRARGPNDAMELRYRRGAALSHTEPLDTRAIPAVVEAAVSEWVRERDSWIHRRGQRVSEAVVTVWPGEVPAGSDRVQQGGQFDVEFLDEG
jgi:hypothetical protein